MLLKEYPLEWIPKDLKFSSTGLLGVVIRESVSLDSMAPKENQASELILLILINQYLVSVCNLY